MSTLEIEEKQILNTINNIAGIADAHGIDQLYWWGEESDDFKQQRAFMIIRANANRQRHSTYFEVSKVSDTDRAVIDRLLSLEKPQSALLYIKGIAPDCGGVKVTTDQASSWDLIPNSQLDPHWTSPQDQLHHEILKNLTEDN